jgi:hypothetical protein
MAKWPDSPKAYPGTPDAYPVAPKAYPAGSINSYPGSATPSPPAPFSPSDIVGVIDWWQSFAGGAAVDPLVTVAGSGVSSWRGQVAATDLAQATDTNRPAVVAADATLNDVDTIDFNGSDNYLRAALVLDAPGTTPVFQYVVWKLNTWTSGRVMSALGATAMSVQCVTSSPRICMLNPTTVNSQTGLGATGTWKRCAFLWNDDVSDFTHIGESIVTGGDAGNNAGTQITLGSNNGLSTFTAETIAFFLLAEGLPTLPELQQLDAYVAALVGSWPLS